MRDDLEDKAAIRNIFGANLRVLTKGAPSISQVCRDLGINRTQFNRYLSAESFPRPDVLKRICDHFEVDARILLEPLETIRPATGPHAFRETRMEALVRFNNLSDDYTTVPEGHYLFHRPSYFDASMVSSTLLRARRDARGLIALDGYIPYGVGKRVGLARSKNARRLIGSVAQQPSGFSFVMTLEAVQSWQIGMVTRSYLGNPNLYAGTSVSVYDASMSFPILVERIETGVIPLVQMRKHLKARALSQASHVVREFFNARTEKPLPTSSEGAKR